MGQTSKVYPNLNNQTQFWLKKINWIQDYFTAEIRGRESMSKGLAKYIATFDYIYENLIFYCKKWWNFLASFATIIDAPVDIASASFSFVFSVTTEIVKKYIY